MPQSQYNQRYDQAAVLTKSDTAQITGPSGQIGTGGILALTSGNVVATFVGGKAVASVTFPVVAGTHYNYEIAYFYIASTATLMGVW